MNVKLTPHSEELLRQYLGKGGYHSPEELIEHALQNLAQAELRSEPRTSILELQGLGKDFWQGRDAQAYVNQERAAWNG